MSKLIKKRLAGKVDLERKNETDISIRQLKEQMAKLEKSMIDLTMRKPICDPHTIKMQGDHAYRLWILETYLKPYKRKNPSAFAGAKGAFLAGSKHFKEPRSD